MAGLTICWEYLTGYVVATDPSSRERCEWPPHPARVFLAMAAAWFETSPDDDATESMRREHQAEGEALRWLESQAEPELRMPPMEREGERSLVTVYVPVNDRAGPAAATLQSVPALTRIKQARTFPRYFTGNQPVALHWPKVEGLETHCDALSRICGKVNRIGHSSSLVGMWLADSSDDDALVTLERWQSDEELPTFHCRRIAPGLLDTLPEQTRILEIERFAEQFWRVEDAEREAAEAKEFGDASRKKIANGAFRDAKKEFECVTGRTFKKSSSPPPRLRPRIGLWSGYRRAEPAEPQIPHTVFDTDMLVLMHQEGPQLPLVATLEITKALRNTIMTSSPVQPVPGWVSGHKSDGSSSDRPDGHLAVLPLPFVGHKHADGHLLGMALAFPRSLPRQERGRILGPLLVDEQGEPRDIRLLLGRMGEWTLRKRVWNEQRLALEPESWTGLPNGSETWASVTPVALDKFPKSDRCDRVAWEGEVRALIVEACRRIGLPTPIHVDIDTTSWQLGSPRAFIKYRRLRGDSAPEARSSARLGNGFPSLPAKGSRVSRLQVHVFLQFESPVRGPIVLGAGRFRGYGLFKPMRTAR